MTVILEFRRGRDVPLPPQAGLHISRNAEIVIFPGVRIERHEQRAAAQQDVRSHSSGAKVTGQRGAARAEE